MTHRLTKALQTPLSVEHQMRDKMLEEIRIKRKLNYAKRILDLVQQMVEKARVKT
jgi:hypothetical protein